MQKDAQKPNFEFIALMAALMSIVALAIDAILPAISNIGVAIHSLDPTDNQMLVTMIFLGLGVGQLFFGPLSDCYGRKPIVYAGFILFLMVFINFGKQCSAEFRHQAYFAFGRSSNDGDILLIHKHLLRAELLLIGAVKIAAKLIVEMGIELVKDLPSNSMLINGKTGIADPS